MRNLFLFVTVSILFLSACSRTVPFKPFASPNPWADNYTSMAYMENYKQWGTYNVHDPACKKLGDYYYMYSTDAIYRENRKEAFEKGVPLGYIQVRRSKDLVHWEFMGWAFPDIPIEAIEWVRTNAQGKGATNIWAPYITPYANGYRLYYSVSAFGRKASYLGMAESTTPEGPWVQKGCVVKTNDETTMNAIDPSVIVDKATGKWWMHYGSYFGGLYCVELNPETGLTLKAGDKGHLVARRANYQHDNLEAPEIVYHPKLKKYFLFTSYDPLMTTYNVRVARSDSPEGPFTDYFGKAIADTTNNFPIVTAPYQFDNHSGWAGTAHCGVVSDDKGGFFMVHQGRLSPDNHLMVLHTRQLFFTADGWPVVSPERYTGSKQLTFRKEDMIGQWEVIRIIEPRNERRLEAGQITDGAELNSEECNTSTHFVLTKEGEIAGGNGNWSFLTNKQSLSLTVGGEKIENLIIFAGHDWENEKETILFTGLDNQGRSVWGKKIR